MRRREGPAVPDLTGAVHAARRRGPAGTPAARRFLLALTIFYLGLAAGVLAEAATAGQQRALLDLTVNGVPRGVTLVIVRGTELWVEAEAIARADVRVDDAGERETIDGRVFIRLSSLAPKVTFEFDEAALVINLTAAPELLARRVVEMRSPRPAGIEYRRDTSGFLNYGLSWSSNAQRSASLEGGFRLGAAQVSTILSHNNLTGTWRGPTSVSVDRRDRLQRWTAGDVIASTGPLGGALSVGGVSVSRDYDLDPYFVRHPTIGLSGAVNAPATVDVYVNDRLVRREQLPPGTFTLNDLPVPVGAGSARVVMRDAFGREQEIGGQYYVTTSLLARGLHQYQYAVGAERLEPSARNWAYDGAVFLGTHRVGITDALTLGGRFEASSRMTSGGPQAVARLGRFGEVEGVLAMSHGTRGTGHAWSASYLYTGRVVSAGGAWRSTDRAYGTLSDLSSPLGGRLALDAGATVSSRVGPRASATVTWQRQRYHDVYPRTDRLSLTSTYRVAGRTELYATVSRSHSGGRMQPSVFLGLTTGIGRRATVGTSAEHTDGRTVVAADAQRSLPAGEGYGYRLRGEGGHAGSLDADLRYQARFGRYELRQSHTAGERSTSLWASGALVGIGGRLFAARPVEQSYALVRVPGVPKVRAFVSHQEIGKTDGRGDLLVPNLLPYYGNVLSIADEDVPLDMTIARREMTLAPPAGGGALALFEVTRDLRVTGRLEVNDHGAAVVPAYGRLVITLPRFSVESPVGAGGEFYLEGLTPGPHPARVEYQGGTCAFTLVVPDRSAAVIPLGVLRCLAD